MSRTPAPSAGYSGTPLPKKLGIKPGSVVALVCAPKDFRETLGLLPEGAKLRAGADKNSTLTLWFTRSREDLKQGIRPMARQARRGPVWIIWPKLTSGVATDLKEQVVREAGLAAGLVDYKVCAVDATWSGLLFARRKSAKRP
ncbi:MAG: DUF3052 domain-containing protein [Terriglobales bacterium]